MVPRGAAELPQTARLFELPADRLLPPSCPWCGAPGTIEHELKPIGLSAETSVRVYACDLCAEGEARRATVRLAWLLCGSLLGATLATALSFYWGERFEALQLACVFVATVAVTVLAPGSTGGLNSLVKVVQPSPFKGALLLESHSSAWSRVLRAEGLHEVDASAFSSQLQKAQSQDFDWRRWSHLLTPTVVALGWWMTLHLFARAEIRVINMGPAQAILLVDERRVLTLPPMRFERPGLGLALPVLAGPRHLKLLTSEGHMLHEETIRLLPGQTALLPRLAPGFCLYLEELDYSKPQKAHFSLLSRGGASVQLKTPVDSWFIPLIEERSRQTTQENEPKETAWMKTQGIRTAIRMLACP